MPSLQPVAESHNAIPHAGAVSLGDLIRRHRGERGWSLRRLAQESGLDPGYLSRVEQGAAPSDAAIDALVRSLALPGLAVDQLRLLKALDDVTPYEAEVLARLLQALRAAPGRRTAGSPPARTG